MDGDYEVAGVKVDEAAIPVDALFQQLQPPRHAAHDHEHHGVLGKCLFLLAR